MLLNRYIRPFAIFETNRRNKPQESIWQTGTGLMKMNFFPEPLASMSSGHSSTQCTMHFLKAFTAIGLLSLGLEFVPGKKGCFHD